MLHARPQAPQLSGFVLRSASHPSSAPGARGRLQLPRLPVQLEVQSPPLQESDSTPSVEQVRPQAPQFNLSVDVLVSQPSSAAGGLGVVQSPKPVLQTGVQVPAAHTRSWVLVPRQARLHAPQLSGLVFRLVSHPSSALGAIGVLQSPKPAAQVGTHEPA